MNEKKFFGEVLITHACCGCKSFERLKCKMSEYDDKIAELEKSLCFKCNEEFENFRSLTRAKELNFIELFGTDKQVLWASKIKFNLLKTIKINIISELLQEISYNTRIYKIDILSKDFLNQEKYFNCFNEIIEKAISVVNNNEKNIEVLNTKNNLFKNLQESLNKLRSDYDIILSEMDSRKIIDMRRNYELNTGLYAEELNNLIEY